MRNRSEAKALRRYFLRKATWLINGRVSQEVFIKDMTFLFSLCHCEQFLKHLNNLCILRRQFLDYRVSVCATINLAYSYWNLSTSNSERIKTLDMGWHQRIPLSHNMQIWFLPPSWAQAFKCRLFFSSGYQTQALHRLGSTLSLDYTSNLCFFFETRSYYYTSTVGLELALK